MVFLLQNHSIDWQKETQEAARVCLHCAVFERNHMVAAILIQFLTIKWSLFIPFLYHRNAVINNTPAALAINQ